jgi:hypothetical protein
MSIASTYDQQDMQLKLGWRKLEWRKAVIQAMVYHVS